MCFTQRAKNRRVDPETGAIYHLEEIPPPTDSKILKRLVRRDLDSDEKTFRQRVDIFRESLRRIVPMFKGRLYKVNGLQYVEDVYRLMSL